MAGDGPDEAPRPLAEARSPGAALTAREAELLGLLAEGLRNDEIAAQLVISVKTVERHLTNLYAKLGTRGRAGAVAYAVHKGVSLPVHGRPRQLPREPGEGKPPIEGTGTI